MTIFSKGHAEFFLENRGGGCNQLSCPVGDDGHQDEGKHRG
jgi:hypothetical protein